jgi:hypothetical protein
VAAKAAAVETCSDRIKAIVSDAELLFKQ